MAVFNTEFRDSKERKAGISAILSKQYNNNDFITVFDESAIPYTHSGNTVNLSHIRLRILDPVTNDVVQGLGNGSVVFFEIVKADSLPNKNIYKSQKNKCWQRVQQI